MKNKKKKKLEAIKKMYFNDLDQLSQKKFDKLSLTDHINRFTNLIKKHL